LQRRFANPYNARVGSERLDKLRKMLQRDPNDTFLLYGIALEHKKLGETKQAIEYLDRVIAADAGYCYAYHQKGLVYESAGDIEAARAAYRAGIEAAKKKGDDHAAGEIQAALDMLT
jgi:tetratricopeptide (TPR) repeat protein